MRGLARWCFRHKYIVVLAWVVAIAGMNAIHAAAGSAYSDNFKLPHTDSFDAIALLQKNAPKASGDTDQVVIAAHQGSLRDPATAARAQAALDRVARTPHVSSVASPFTA